MPRAKKSFGEAVDKRNGTKLALLPAAITQVPDAPKGLLKSTQQRWHDFWTDSVAGLIQPAEMGLIERYFTYVDEWSRSMTAFRKDRFIEGSMGQPKLNPLSTYIKQLEGDISSLEDRLGLSPKARLALGIAVGQAQRTLADLNAELDVEDDDSDEWVVLESDTGTQ